MVTWRLLASASVSSAHGTIANRFSSSIQIRHVFSPPSAFSGETTRVSPVFMIGIWKWQNVKDGSCRDECPVNESVFRCLRVPSFGGVARLQPLKGHKSYGDTGGDTGLTT